MAALAHFFGLVIALIVWATQKDKSAYVRFQALQAMVFDLIWVVFSVGAVFCTLALSIVLFFVGAFASATRLDPGFANALFSAPYLVWILLFPCLIGTVVLRLFVVFQVLQGRAFRYPWLGKKIVAFVAKP